ncbi:carboxy terminal-processing peptidase [Pseudomaricurvus alkylphenolicus]|jgi:carboxyl-terminal processing protease|uniref:carboxy terminal-processing peptidase n=1 Tax=Pseudomaricurvus alkylphenolicus TaxID=1306991 RepID=UPI00142245BC|nr:carboxy terminal-processing peptidase [Pseudomaricurvus alkylphenolicus]NIB41110.1 carboxy terminal-processing peptidase [Pseudomaricurvus alkylphenolicus]
MRKLQRQFLLSLAAAGLLSITQLAPAKSIDFSFTKDQSKTAVDIIDKLSTRHYRNQEFNDELSEAMLDKFISNLDPSKYFFLQSDIDLFEKRYARKLDDTLSSGDLEPGRHIFTTYYERAHERLTWAIALLEGNGASEFDFSRQESIPLGEDNQRWAQSEPDADEKWRKRIKSSILSLKLADESIEDAQKTLLRRYKNQLTRLEQQDADDVFEIMINALTLLYDPHTSYLSPRTLENFNISMSLSLEGIGAVLQTEDEFTKVVRLITAGPASKQGELKPADKIVSVGQGPEGEMVDVIGWRLDEVVKLIRGPKNTVVRLSVIPADSGDNSIRKEIRINRGKVKLEEQAAKKGIIELSDGEEVFKLGVINVPAFYIDFEAYRRRDPNFKSTTTDVLRLLKELEQENIDGLIVDLRNNGGGSLQEATTLTDLFIDQGPVVQIRQTSQTISRNYRSRRRAAYRGPLVVLTNRLSASASEIFAGAIQDYKRGLIVGTQSFGKGTVQSLTPVYSGQLKITESKFYRVSGDSTQHRGVIPDVNFPFLVDAEEVGESSYDTALPWDQIHPVPHEAYFNFEGILKEVKRRHEGRKAEDPDFVYLNQQVTHLRSTKDQTELSLNEKVRREQQVDRRSRALAIENSRREAKGLEPFLTSEAWEKDSSDRSAEQSAAPPSEDLDTDNDALLAEAGYILIDMLNLLEKQPPDQVADF